MASGTKPELQTAYTDWSRRAGQFRAAGIPDSMWANLYQRDMHSVDAGGTPMNDAEVYTEVRSAWQGPQIADPKPATGHSFFSDIGHVLGNIGSDIGGIVRGFIPETAHLVSHLPSEVANTWDLTMALAGGDNPWLRSHGYLSGSEQLYNTPSHFFDDLGTIIKAMSRHGDKQLWPIIPGIADAANLQTPEGRQYLEQHPVSGLIDILPYVSKAGKVATAGKDFGPVPSTLDDILRTPRFYSAGRALQAGNPVKAAISTLGDILPATRDEALGRLTARQQTAIVAHVLHLDRSIREGLNRPVSQARNLAQARIESHLQENLGDLLHRATPERLQNIGIIAHGLVPDPSSPMGMRAATSAEELAAATAKLDAVDRAILDIVSDVSLVHRGTEREAKNLVTIHGEDYAKDSPVTRAQRSVLKHSDRLNIARLRIENHFAKINTAEKVTRKVAERDSRLGKALDYYRGRQEDLEKAQAKLDRLRIGPDSEIPARMKVLTAQRMRDLTLAEVHRFMHGEDLRTAINTIVHSEATDEFVKLLGRERYEAFVADSVNLWQRMAEQNANVIYLHNMDLRTDLNVLLRPRINTTRIPDPAFLKPRTRGIDFSHTIMDPVAALTAMQGQLLSKELAEGIFNTHVLTSRFTKMNPDGSFATREQIRAEIVKDLEQAAKHTSWTARDINEKVTQIFDARWSEFDPESFGVRRARLNGFPRKGSVFVDTEALRALQAMGGEGKFATSIWRGKQIVFTGTSIYKTAVLTGPRHFAHVAFGGLTMMMLRDPLAPVLFAKSLLALRGKLPDLPKEQLIAWGLVQHPYERGPALRKVRTPSGRQWRTTKDLENLWDAKAGIQLGNDLLRETVHEAAKKGVKAATWLPNKMARLEETVLNMYRVSTFLSARDLRHLDQATALEHAHKVFVDMDGMSNIEHNVIRQIFPFYAFTRHLFRFLMTYSVDYPMAAAVISMMGEQEQDYWKSGLPRSYQMLFNLGNIDAHGNRSAIDLKNVNPFRSFANDFSLAGFMSSLSPFITGPLQLAGLNTLSGTTQLYPSVTYDPQTGSLQATHPPGGLWRFAESFVPEAGLIDHFFGMTSQARLLAVYNPAAYHRQLYDLLNIPFVPTSYNVPYVAEETENKRYIDAQKAVSTLERDPSQANIDALERFNVVPWHNQLVPATYLADYYSRVKDALDRMGYGQLSPRAVLRTPPSPPARLANL